MNWTTIENAIHAWVVTGSGLAATQVIWEGQDGPMPEGAFITLRFAGLERTGSDWLDVDNNPTPTPGAEIIFRARGGRRANLTVTAYPGNATGALASIGRLESVIASRRLPSVADPLSSGGLGVLGFGAIRSLDGFVSGGIDFEPRASVEINLYLTSQISETATFIETAEVSKV
jgi:hypothetical protein